MVFANIILFILNVRAIFARKFLLPAAVAMDDIPPEPQSDEEDFPAL